MSSNGGNGGAPRHPKVPAEIKPGFVLPVLQEETDRFQERAKKYRIGDEDEEEFRMFRLHHGVYGQRQADEQMIRVKLPYGGVTADQMEALAKVAERYSDFHRGHITTRENFQFHFVNLDDAPEVMRITGEVGLTTREACAHTVRNVTGCPFAGVCPEEVFDATPYLAAYARNMLRNPICQSLPRKFKTAFSSCAGDCAGTPFHDLGFIAKVQSDGKGGEVRGFEIRVGGGLSTMPRKADTIYEFAAADNGEYIRVAEAILRVYDREGDQPGLLRKNLSKARIKFLLHKIGVDEFRRMVQEELEGDWAKEPLDMEALMALAPENPTPGQPSRDGGQVPPGFERWRRTNVRLQRQKGYVALIVAVPIGNISTGQFRSLARIMRQYAGGNGRTNQNQNLVLRWVREDALPQVYRELQAIDLGDPDAELLADVVACPGADSCKLAITASNQAGYAIREALMAYDYSDPEVRKVSVKISGCPNGCGQHHVGGIGLQGSAFKVEGREVPCYDIFVGGGGYHGGARYGTRVTRVLAKKAHLAINRVLEVYQRERQEGESFLDFVDRVGPKSFEPHLEEFKWVGPLHQDIDMYLDWGSEEFFQVIRGEGECAAGQLPINR
ncbi:MAG: nitrite/sulfite reductase [Dehalococcoidia bacterium]